MFDERPLQKEESAFDRFVRLHGPLEPDETWDDYLKRIKMLGKPGVPVPPVIRKLGEQSPLPDSSPEGKITRSSRTGRQGPFYSKLPDTPPWYTKY